MKALYSFCKKMTAKSFSAIDTLSFFCKKMRVFNFRLLALLLLYGCSISTIYANITYPNGNTNTSTTQKAPTVATGCGNTYNLLMEGNMPNQDGQGYANHGLAQQGGGYVTLTNGAATTNYFNNYGSNDGNAVYSWISGGDGTNSSNYVAIRMRLATGVTTYPNLEFGFHENNRNACGINHKNYTAWTSNGADALPALTTAWQWIVFKTENCCGGGWKRIYIKGGAGVIEISDAYYCENFPAYPGYSPCGAFAAATYTAGTTAALRGSSWNVGDQIQWRNFDLLSNGNEGGDGCTFHRSAGQDGNFRGTGFSNDNPDMGWARKDSWLQYTFQITQAGNYTVSSNAHRRNTTQESYIEYQVYQGGTLVGGLTLSSPALGASTDYHIVTSTASINLAVGTYQLRVILKSPNGDGDMRILWNRINAVCTPPTANAGVDINNAPIGAPTTLAATALTAGQTGAWTIVSGGTGTFSNASSPTSTFTPSAVGVYTLRWTVTITATGCNASDDMVFTTVIPPVPCVNPQNEIRIIKIRSIDWASAWIADDGANVAEMAATVANSDMWYEIPTGETVKINGQDLPTYYYKNYLTGRYLYRDNTNNASNNGGWCCWSDALTSATNMQTAYYKFVMISAVNPTALCGGNWAYGGGVVAYFMYSTVGMSSTVNTSCADLQNNTNIYSLNARNNNSKVYQNNNRYWYFGREAYNGNGAVYVFPVDYVPNTECNPECESFVEVYGFPTEVASWPNNANATREHNYAYGKFKTNGTIGRDNSEGLQFFGIAPNWLSAYGTGTTAATAGNCRLNSFGTGDYIEWTNVNGGSGGTGVFKLIASQAGGGTAELFVNGTSYGTIRCQQATLLNGYSIDVKNITLNQGTTNTIRLVPTVSDCGIVGFRLRIPDCELLDKAEPTVINKTCNSIQIQWNKVTDATNYRLYISESALLADTVFVANIAQPA
ncbi:MAG: carbohydrate-binding protein, partial [Prevotellaceae bacterium]|nr:carbohydrate-binding protein [Prevotellaceae bacterium]